MLKTSFVLKGGKRVLVLGLEEENVRRLKLDKPIKIDATELGLPNVEIFIVYGETAEIIQEKLLGTKN